MSTSPDPLEWLLSPASHDIGVDRKALAGLLLDIAQNVKPDLRDTPTTNLPHVDTRLEQLRALLLGREIEILARLSAIIEDPEQLATAVGRILPTARFGVSHQQHSRVSEIEPHDESVIVWARKWGTIRVQYRH